VNEPGRILVYLLEILFAAGVLGSALVILLSMVEDFEVWFAPKEANGGDNSATGTHPDVAAT
jgi:hypothetical protein